MTALPQPGTEGPMTSNEQRQQPMREHVLTATRLPHLPEHLFWIASDEKSGSGLTFGPGFKAFAKDFPEGTRLVITARIEAP